jgi:thymidylate synthase (FAD)
MRIVEQGFSFEGPVNGLEMLERIERAGRTCYKSEAKITAGSAIDFVRMLLKRGHESVLEHEKVTVRIVCDRGVSHEIVRHRIASYSQESTRYCNYGKTGGIAVIEPSLELGSTWRQWHDTMQTCENTYLAMLKAGISPQIARSVLPQALKTELVMTANLREWRHFFRLRTSKAAHPQMRALATGMLEAFRREIPVVFEDIAVEA